MSCSSCGSDILRVALYWEPRLLWKRFSSGIGIILAESDDEGPGLCGDLKIVPYVYSTRFARIRLVNESGVAPAWVLGSRVDKISDKKGGTKQILWR